MNAQITFILEVYNLTGELSAEELAKQIEAKIEPIISKTIGDAAENESWITGLETRLKEDIMIPDTVRRVFEANDIELKITAKPKRSKDAP